MKKEKLNMVFYVLIVLVVLLVLVLITINGKREMNNNIQQPNDVSATIPAGLKITTLVEGTGNAVKAGDTVAMNYTGTLADGTVFDSNIDPKFNHVQPFVFTVGDGKVIKGWDLGIAGMKVGEKRTLEIAPDLAYGAAGYPPVIPQNATLSFEVELLAIK